MVTNVKNCLSFLSEAEEELYLALEEFRNEKWNLKYCISELEKDIKKGPKEDAKEKRKLLNKAKKALNPVRKVIDLGAENNPPVSKGKL